MFELKKIHREAIPKALERVERYRLLNQPLVAESICRDSRDSSRNVLRAVGPFRLFWASKGRKIPFGRFFFCRCIAFSPSTFSRFV